MGNASKLQLELAVADMAENVRMATKLLTTDPKAARVFRAVEDGRGTASGWAIAKTAEIPTDEAQFFLDALKNYGVVESTDPGLDGYYSLTKLGFDLRSGFSIAV
jgi:predicted transcriptional regulator